MAANSSALFTNRWMLPNARDSLADLINDVRSVGLPHGIENSVLTKLLHAQQELSDDRTRLACNQLDALANQLSGVAAADILTTAQTQQLTDATRHVQSAIPCS